MIGHWSPTFNCLEKGLTVVQIVSEYSGWLVVAHSNTGCMAAASSAKDRTVVVNGITVHEKSGIFSFNVVQNDRIMCKPITTCEARTTNIFL